MNSARHLARHLPAWVQRRAGLHAAAAGVAGCGCSRHAEPDEGDAASVSGRVAGGIVEKFADPFYDNCTKRGDPLSPGLPYVFPPASVEAWQFNLRGGTGDPDQPRFNGLGYEYLRDVPNTAHDRVAAMRAKINRIGSARSQQIDPVVEVSSASLRQFAMGLQKLYREAESASAAGDPSKWTALAKATGVTVPQAISDYARISEVLGIYPAESVELAKALLSSMSTQILGLARQIVDTIKTEIASTGAEMSDEMASTLGSLAGVVPVAGAMVKAALDIYSKWAAMKETVERGYCDNANAATTHYIKKTLAYNLPPQLHLLDVFTNAFVCASATGESTHTGWQQDVARRMYRENLQLLIGDKATLGATDSYFHGLALPVSDQEIIGWWWGLATAFMAHPDVEPVFRAMNRDVNGGMFASDEQVMLVAAPVAIAYGLNVDEFAMLLWDRSAGWRSRPALFQPYTYTTGILTGDTICTTVAVNAMQIQWAVLAQDAYTLAEDAKNGKIPSLGRSKPIDIGVMLAISVDPPEVRALDLAAQRARKRLPYELAVGVVATAATYLAGFPLRWLTAAPLAAVALIQYRERHPVPKKQPPPVPPPPKLPPESVLATYTKKPTTIDISSKFRLG